MASRRKTTVRKTTQKQETKVAKRTKQYDDDDENENEQPKARPSPPPGEEVARPRMIWNGELPVKRWLDTGVCIDFPKGEAVSLAHLAPHAIESMRRMCEGNDNWLFEPRPE